jgi:molecular chaperone GrpE
VTKRHARHPEDEVQDGVAEAAVSEEGTPAPHALQQMQAERDALQDQLLRTVADMQNLRKRMQQESQQIRLFATEDLVRELLPVLDNFERTIAAGEQGASVATLLEGVRAVDRQLRNALERRNIKRIEAHGQAFDPDLHEAIATDESEDHPEGTVTLEIEPGYKMAERVIRPARVRVARKP